MWFNIDVNSGLESQCLRIQWLAKSVESRIFTAEDCLARGLVDELVAPETLLDRAVECARKLASPPGRSFAITKRLLRRPAIDRLEREGSRSEEILAAWSSDEVLGAVRAYVQRILRK